MLTTSQRQKLKGLAHHKDPVVLVGNNGVSDEVVAKTKEELENHELIKVRLGGERAEVKADAEKLAAAAGADLVQVIGKIAILYRRRKEKPEIRV